MNRSIALFLILMGCGPGVDWSGRDVCFDKGDCLSCERCIEGACVVDSSLLNACGACEPTTPEEICGDGKDNDCDGDTDEGCAVNTCGNGVVDLPDETCDTAIANGLAGSCPISCDDGLVCTQDSLIGNACTLACDNQAISACVGGDGCCASGCNEANDSDCATTWAVEIGTNDTELEGMIVGADGALVVTGGHFNSNSLLNNLVVLKIGADGNALWQMLFESNTESRGVALTQTQDNGYAVAGKILGGGGATDWDFWIVKVAGDGQVLWQKQSGGSGQDLVYTIGEDSAGALWVGGYTSSFGGSGGAWLMKVDGSTGNILWQKKADIGSSINALAPHSNGAMIAVGHYNTAKMWAAAFNTTGVALWQKLLAGVGAQGHAVATPSGGEIIIAGSDYSNAHIAVLDDAGNRIRHVAFDGGANEFGYALAATADAMWFGGLTQSFKPTGRLNNTWLVALASDASVTWQAAYGHSTMDMAKSLQRLSDGRLAVLNKTVNGASGSSLMLLSPAGSVDSGACPGGLGVSTSASAAAVTDTVADGDIIFSATGATAATTAVISGDPALTIVGICN